MLRLIVPISSVIAACTPSPQKAAMPSPSPYPPIAAQGAQDSGSPASASPGHGGKPHEQAAQAPIPEAVSAAENPLPSPFTDSPAEAQGRRTLSTAFVQVGPDGHLTVELRDGRVLVLRDVVMRPKDYCGAQVTANVARARYCGGYAEVAAARPGGVGRVD